MTLFLKKRPLWEVVIFEVSVRGFTEFTKIQFRMKNMIYANAIMCYSFANYWIDFTILII